MKTTLALLEKTIGVSFANKDLLRQALTHSSYAYEQSENRPPDNEVLEFLGDSVIGLVTADFFCRAFAGLKEGDLSKYKSAAANTETLSDFALQIKLDRHVFLGKGEEKSGGRKKRTILAGTFEALAAAVYLDQGYEAAKGFLLPLLRKSFRRTDPGSVLINDYKSALQEYFQKASVPAPSYRTVTSIGPDHSRTFFVEVYHAHNLLARAKGPSKKSAEQAAAQKALKNLLGRKMKGLRAEMFVLKR
jgi:ribonuclease III